MQIMIRLHTLSSDDNCQELHKQLNTNQVVRSNCAACINDGLMNSEHVQSGSHFFKKVVSVQ